MAFKPNMIAIMTTLLLAFALVFFAVQFIYANNPDGSIEIQNNQKLNSTINSIQGNATSISNVINEQKSEFEKDEPSSSFLFLMFRTAFSIPKALFAITGDTITLITEFTLPELFGSESTSYFWVAIIIINIILVMIILFSVIKYARTGQDEL